MTHSEEIVATLVSTTDYPHHINQVASVGTEFIRVLRRKISIKTPYELETIAVARCRSVEYKAGLSPVRIVVGTMLVALILAIFYFINLYWASFEAGQTFKVGALVLALLYGLRWAFMSRSHRFVFHMNDGTRLKWRSRSGDFKYKKRAVENVLRFAAENGWSQSKHEPRI